MIGEYWRLDETCADEALPCMGYIIKGEVQHVPGASDRPPVLPVGMLWKCGAAGAVVCQEGVLPVAFGVT